MKSYTVLKDLPFNIKAGETVEYDELTKKSFHNGKEIPFKVNLEKDFFKEVIPKKFKQGDKVLHKINNKFQVFEVVGYSKPSYRRKEKVELKNSNFKSLFEDGSKLVLAEQYWFLNSEGMVCTTYIGLNEKADNFRKLSGNMFSEKTLAQIKLEIILK